MLYSNLRAFIIYRKVLHKWLHIVVDLTRHQLQNYRFRPSAVCVKNPRLFHGKKWNTFTWLSRLTQRRISSRTFGDDITSKSCFLRKEITDVCGDFHNLLSSWLPSKPHRVVDPVTHIQCIMAGCVLVHCSVRAASVDHVVIVAPQRPHHRSSCPATADEGSFSIKWGCSITGRDCFFFLPRVHAVGILTT